MLFCWQCACHHRLNLHDHAAAFPISWTPDPTYVNPALSATTQVQKSASHYTEAARDEITLLSQISEGDPDSTKHCCRLLDSFEHSGPHGLHVCMVFEVLGDNLLSLIKAFDYKGVPLPIVRTLVRQMLVGLDYLHRCVCPCSTAGGVAGVHVDGLCAHGCVVWCVLMPMCS
jgi:serine/threonine protein kinase